MCLGGKELYCSEGSKKEETFPEHALKSKPKRGEKEWIMHTQVRDAHTSAVGLHWGKEIPLDNNVVTGV